MLENKISNCGNNSIKSKETAILETNNNNSVGKNRKSYENYPMHVHHSKNFPSQSNFDKNIFSTRISNKK